MRDDRPWIQENLGEGIERHQGNLIITVNSVLVADQDDAGTYGGRSTGSERVPGALIEDFKFNL